ncbi:hypothetical protein ACH6CV_17090 [Bacillota bacterium Meth-B3]
MARSHGESVAINAGAGYVLMIVNHLVSFFVRTIVIKMLGVEYTGISALFADILNTLSLAELGLGTAITFALYKPIREGEYRRIAALMHFYKKAYRLIAAFVLLAGLALVPFLHLLVKGAPDIREDLRLIFMLYVVKNAASYLLAYKRTILVASEKRYLIANYGVWSMIVRTAVECLVLWLTRNFVLYLLVGLAEALLLNAVISRKANNLYPQLREYPDAQISKEETRKLLKDVGALSLYKICQVMLNSTDSIVISAAPALGVVIVGYLSNYRMIYNTINAALDQFYNAFIPSLGSMAAGADGERQHRVFQTTNFLSFWGLCFACTSLFCLSVPFVQNIWLRDRQFGMPMDIIAVLTLNFYTSAMMRPTNAFRDSNGLFVQGKFRPVAMAAINIVGDIVLVGPLGIFGVLLATSISRLSTQTWYDPWLLYRKVFNRPVRPYYIQYITYLFLTALSCAVTYGLCRLTLAIPHMAPRFLAMMALCATVPNALVVLLYRKTEAYRDVIARFKQVAARLTKRLGRAA